MNKRKKYINHKIVILCAFILGILIAVCIKTLDPDKVYITLEEKRNLEHQIDMENKQIEKLRNIKVEYEKDLEKYERKSLDEKSVKELMEYELSYLKDITGESKVKGEGIIITIKDSENDLKENQNPNELIVHDIDILRIVNDLKKAGFTSISINEERLLTLSKIKSS